jgi:hypothetical protein
VTAASARLAEIVIASGARRVAFLGLAKNVGKTTALLAALEALADRGVATGAVSAGRDGEAVDAITGEPKPRYRVREGQLLASARSAFAAASFPSRLLEELPFSTRFGPIEIRRAAGTGEVEMIGPATASELGATADALERHGASLVLLDGALGRRAFASARVADAVVLSAGLAAGASMNGAVEAARSAAYLLALQTPSPGGRVRHVNGALTDDAFRELAPRSGDVLAVEDFASVFLSSAEARALQENGVALAVRRPARLLAVTVNPTAPARAPLDPARFLVSVAKALPTGVPVLDVVSGVVSGVLS